MIVVDASAVISLLVESAAESALIRDRMAVVGEAYAPHLIDVEVASAFRRLVRQGRVGAARGHRALRTFLDLPIVRFPHSPLVARIWELRDRLSAYDATYVSLAERLGATLLTRDRRLLGAGGHRAQIELV
jgi:predicted nucleic acid-binding protein